MFVIPVDLFSSYIKGREQGITNNWNDLNQYNTVQGGQLRNDAQQLQNWFTEDTYNPRVSQVQSAADIAGNNAITSGLNTQVRQAQQPGQLALTNLGSDYQTNLAAGLQPTIPSVVQGKVDQTLGQANLNMSRGVQQQAFAPQQAEYEMLNNIQALNNNYRQQQDIANTAPVRSQNAQLEQQLQNTLLNYRLQNPGQYLNPYGNLNTAGTTIPRTQSNDALTFMNAASAVPLGQEMPISVNGTSYTAGRDGQGLYMKLSDGTKHYLNSANATVQTNPAGGAQPLFSFGG